MIRESVGTLASRAVADDVIRRALEIASLHQVPAGGSALREFIEAHLHAAASFALGADAADALAQMLGPIVRRIPSEIPARFSPVPRAADVHERETAVPEHVPTVLLATLDAGRAKAFEGSLPGVRVLLVQDVVGLLDIVGASPVPYMVVVVDCLHPSVHPATLATVAPDMKVGTEFVLWGAREQQVGDQWMFADRTETWVRCPEGAPLEQVAKAIRALLPV